MSHTPRALQLQPPPASRLSRAADNLFWLGRYVERGEATLRLVRTLISRATERDAAPTIDRIASLLAAWSAVPEDIPFARPAAIATAVLQGRDLEGSLPRLVGAARSAASVIGDRFSPDAWRARNVLLEISD